MTNYLVEQSVGGIIRAAFAIYGRYLVTLTLVYTVPTLPFIVLQQEASANKMPVLTLVAVLLSTFAGFIGFAAITVAVSDICLGNRPRVGRSLSKAFGKLIGRLLVTGLLQGLILLAAGFPSLFLLLASSELTGPLQGVTLVLGALLAVTFLVLMTWFMFAQAIVVLEGRSGWDALKRSKALGTGHYWRNVGVIGLVLVIFFAIVIVFGLVIGIVSAFAPGGLHLGWVRMFHAISETGLFLPVMFVALTLTYYDLRVRKEAYDTKALSEELAR